MKKTINSNNELEPARELQPNRGGARQSIDYTNLFNQQNKNTNSSFEEKLTQKEEDRKLQKKVQELVWFFQNSSSKSSNRNKRSQNNYHSQVSNLPFKKNPQSSKSQLSHSSVTSVDNKGNNQTSSSPNLISYSSYKSSYNKQVKTLKAAITQNTLLLKKASKTPVKGRNTPSILKSSRLQNNNQMNFTTNSQISSYQINKKAVGSLQHSSTTSMISSGNQGSISNQLHGMLSTQNQSSGFFASKIPSLQNNNLFNSASSQTNSSLCIRDSTKLPLLKESGSSIGNFMAKRSSNTATRSFIGDSSKKSGQYYRNKNHNFNPSSNDKVKNMTQDELSSGYQKRLSPEIKRKKTPIKGKGFGFNIAQQKKSFPSKVKAAAEAYNRKGGDSQQSLSNEQPPQFYLYSNKKKSPSPVKSLSNLQNTLKKSCSNLRKKNYESLWRPKFQEEYLEHGEFQERPK